MKPWERKWAKPGEAPADGPWQKQWTTSLPDALKEASSLLPAANLQEARAPALLQAFDDLPAYIQPFAAAQDMADIGMDTLTRGWADKAGAKLRTSLFGEDYDTVLAAARQRTDDARSRAGIAGLGVDMLGAALPAAKAAQIGASFTRLPVIGGALGLVADGAADGALNAAGHDTDILTGAGTGAAFGAAGRAAQPVLSKVLTLAAPKAPSLDSLKAMTSKAYADADALGAAYRPSAVETMARQIAKDMAAKNLSATRHPKADSMMNDIADWVRQGVPRSLTELDQLRQTVNRDVTGSSDAAEAYFGKSMAAGIDDFMNSAGPSQMASGNGRAAADAIAKARGLNTRLRNSELVGEKLYRAETRAGASASGGSPEAAARQRLADILSSKKDRRGFPPALIEAMEKAARTTPAQRIGNALGGLASVSPRGDMASGAAALGGHTIGGPLGGLLASGVPIATGLAAKGLANRSSRKAMDSLFETVRRGSPPPALSEDKRRLIATILRSMSAAGTNTQLQEHR